MDAVKPAGAAVAGHISDAKMLDPALLQVLSYAANLTLQEEEDALGRSRDDSLAVSWDPRHRRYVLYVWVLTSVLSVIVLYIVRTSRLHQLRSSRVLGIMWWSSRSASPSP